MPALNGTQKSNVTAVESALNTAIASLTNRSNPYETATVETLKKMRQLLESIRNERTQ